MSSKNLRQSLNQRLEGARRLCILGMGSELRSDDGAAMLVVEALTAAESGGRFPAGSLQALWGSTAPENLTGEIRRFKPTHLILIDTADMGLEPGGMALIDFSDIDGVSFSTHRLPTTILADYILATIECSLVIIGIQPAVMTPCGEITEPIRRAAGELTAMIIEIAAATL